MPFNLKITRTATGAALLDPHGVPICRVDPNNVSVPRAVGEPVSLPNSQPPACLATADPLRPALAAARRHVQVGPMLDVLEQHPESEPQLRAALADWRNTELVDRL